MTEVGCDSNIPPSARSRAFIVHLRKEGGMNVVIRNVRLIDGTGADPVPRASLEVTNGVISWIGEEMARPRRRVHQEDIRRRGSDHYPRDDRLP